MMKLRYAGLCVLCALALAACGKGDKAKETETAPAAGTAAAPAASKEEKVLNVYNWSDYIAEDTVANFQKETGIKVNYDMYDSNEVLETKLLAGNSGYDVVVPSASFLERQIKAGVFRKLDKSQLTNLKNMDPEIMQRVALHDPGNEHAVDYMWGTSGIGYNADKLQKALPNAPVDTWALVFDPKNAAKLKGCGLTLLDDPGEITAIVLNYLGKDPNSQSSDDLAAAEKTLMSIRPFVRYIHSSQYIGDLANGEVCVSVGYSGDILQSRTRAEEAKKGVTIKYSVPKEGTIIWFDMLAIPADAPHPNNAHLFINYIMRPEVTAAISNAMSYANGNAAALQFVDDAVKNDPGVYPPPEVKAKLFPDLAKSAEYTRLLNRTWTRFKTGK
ncbi:MAG TPA: polyamine ABC transporter substrate-binding protein [Steroidobacteraceae bacterium]|jgi:putrescine transport system substrate-binding protein|nr:polyamine ABC transporter substrate-binding protein [Steroidobacteraceae bacterium]